MARRPSSCSRAPLRAAAALAFLSAVVVLESPSRACEPVPEFPWVGFASRSPATDDIAKIPKNAGILFDVNVGELGDAAARQRVTVVVRSGGNVIPGALRTVGKADPRYLHWQWLPDGATELPVGTLDVHVTSPDRVLEETITVEDRVVEPTAVALSVATTRELYGDESSPQIHCSDDEEGGVGSCSAGRRMTWTQPTRAKAYAKMNVVIPDIPEADKPYFEATFRLYGRTKGATGPVSVITGKAALAMLEGSFDEYCAEVVVASLADGSQIAGETKCVASTFDTGALTVEEEKAFVSHSLQTCSNPVYPSGTDADNPTGRDGGGCAIGARAPASKFGAAVFIGLCALALRRRRVIRINGTREA